jgi:Arc/MetJ-type ribon-helix-helix transcriptional regulator
MTSLNVNLPDDLKSFAEQRAAEMGFRDTSAYVESLLDREAKRQKTKLEIEAELIRGLDSGHSIDADSAYWQQKKAELTARRGGDSK